MVCGGGGKDASFSLLPSARATPAALVTRPVEWSVRGLPPCAEAFFALAAYRRRSPRPDLCRPRGRRLPVDAVDSVAPTEPSGGAAFCGLQDPEPRATAPPASLSAPPSSSPPPPPPRGTSVGPRPACSASSAGKGSPSSPQGRWWGRARRGGEGRWTVRLPAAAVAGGGGVGQGDRPGSTHPTPPPHVLPPRSLAPAASVSFS